MLILRAFTFLLGMILSSQALVLEDIIANHDLETFLANKKVGFYIGSFDPLHLGHEEAAELPIIKKLCDYVIIYPAWGSDSYKKRIDVKLRLDMLFAVFKDHPHIIVTCYNPQELQNTLAITDPSRFINGKPTVKAAFSGTEFIGIIGSDVAFDLEKNKEACETFMQGIQVPDKYKVHTLGSVISLPVDSFIVLAREDDDVSLLKGKLRDRKIIAVLPSSANRKQLSSSLVRKTLKNGGKIDLLVPSSIISIIEKNNLYQ